MEGRDHALRDSATTYDMPDIIGLKRVICVLTVRGLSYASINSNSTDCGLHLTFERRQENTSDS